MLVIGLAALVLVVALLGWRLALANDHGETVTDADKVVGTWKPIRVLGEPFDTAGEGPNISIEAHGDTWAFRADDGCNAVRGYLDIDPSGQVTVRVLGLYGPAMACHGGYSRFPNVEALLATGRIQLADDNTVYLYDGDDMLASYDLVRAP